MKLFLAFTALLLSAGQGHSAVIKAGPDWQAVAEPGDVVQFGQGDWGRIHISRKWSAPGVVLEPAPGADLLVSFTVANAANVTIRGFRLGSWNPVSDSEAIVFDRIRIYGDSAETRPQNGIQITTCRGCVVQRSEFRGLSWAVQHHANIDLTIDSNSIADATFDAIRGGDNTRGLKITNNHCHHVRLKGDAHRDCIQLWTNAAGPTVDVVVADNRIERGPDGGSMQAILMNDPGRTGFWNMVIERNSAIGPAFHCGAVSGVRTGRIVDNFCQAAPGQGAWFQFGAFPPEVVVRNNWSSGNKGGDKFVQIRPAKAWNDYSERERWAVRVRAQSSEVSNPPVRR